jgi:hypothetical protein
MSETETPVQPEQVRAVPVEAVVNYLADIYRQLDAISFNIRSNINNIAPKQEGEPDVNNQE